MAFEGSKTAPSATQQQVSETLCQMGLSVEDEVRCPKSGYAIDMLVHGTLGMGGDGLCDSCSKVLQKPLVCAQCKTATYCSKDCQIKAWKAGHKGECVAAARADTRTAAKSNSSARTWAVEYDGPSHFLASLAPTGATLLKRRHLQLLGHALVSVPYWEWGGCKGAGLREQYLRGKLGSCDWGEDQKGVQSHWD